MVTFVVHWQTFTAGRELTVSTIHVTDLLRMLRARSRLLFKVFTFFSHSLDKIRHKEVTFKLFQPTCRYRWSVFAQRTCNLFMWIRCPTFKAGETETMSTRQDTWINEDFHVRWTLDLKANWLLLRNSWPGECIDRTAFPETLYTPPVSQLEINKWAPKWECMSSTLNMK